MKVELSEREVTRRLKQASLLRHLCLSLSRASIFGISETAQNRVVGSGEKGFSAPILRKDSNYRL